MHRMKVGTSEGAAILPEHHSSNSTGLAVLKMPGLVLETAVWDVDQMNVCYAKETDRDDPTIQAII